MDNTLSLLGIAGAMAVGAMSPRPQFRHGGAHGRGLAR
jgi:hypothetical protein